MRDADIALQHVAAAAPDANPAMRIVDLTSLGLVDYPVAVDAMNALVARPRSAPDIVLLLDHPLVATFGRAGGAEHLRGGGAVPVHQVARGGNVTMHAPGQLIGYPIVQLAQLEGKVGTGPLGDLPAYVRLLEEALVAVCAKFGVTAYQRAGFSGVWCGETQKIASIGVGVRNGWALHGFALNVDPDLAVFDAMVPCGLAGVRMTSLAEQLGGRGPTVPEVAGVVTVELQQRLRRRTTY